MAPFFVVKWPPNQIIVATQKGNHCPGSSGKLVPTIIDKNTNCWDVFQHGSVPLSFSCLICVPSRTSPVATTWANSPWILVKLIV